MAVVWTIDQARVDSVLIEVTYNPDGSPQAGNITTKGRAIRDDGVNEVVMWSLERADNYWDLPQAVREQIRDLVKTASKGLSQQIAETTEIELPTV